MNNSNPNSNPNNPDPNNPQNVDSMFLNHAADAAFTSDLETLYNVIVHNQNLRQAQANPAWPPGGVCYSCYKHLLDHSIAWPFPLAFDANTGAPEIIYCRGYQGLIIGSPAHMIEFDRHYRADI